MGRRKGSKNKPKPLTFPFPFEIPLAPIPVENPRKRRKLKGGPERLDLLQSGDVDNEISSTPLKERVQFPLIPSVTPTMTDGKVDNGPKFHIFPDLPSIEVDDDGLKRFQSLATVVLLMIRQVSTLSTFIHRTEMEFVVKYVISLYDVEDDESDFSDNDSDIDEQDRKLQKNMLYLSQILKFTQSKIVHYKRIQDLFLLDIASIGMETIIPSISSSAGVHTVSETEEQCAILCNYFAKGSVQNKQKFHERFEQLHEILKHLKSFYEAILEVKWMSLQMMRNSTK